jgi:hypothetical protein
MKRRAIISPLVLLVIALVAAGCSSAAEQATEEAEPAVMEEKLSSEKLSSQKMVDEADMEDEPAEEMMDEGEAMDESEEEPMDAAADSTEVKVNEESMDESAEEAMEEAELMDESTDEPMDESAEEPMEEDAVEAGDGEMMESEASILSLELNGLEDLGQDWAYEGWLIVDGAPVSTGVFEVDGEGMASVFDFEVDAEQLAAAELFVLTIEPVPDPDPAPSPVHILAGSFEEDSAELSIAHPAALGTDFASAEGSTYILGIPSSGMGNTGDDSYTSGIWFDGLNLPELPAGWVYEGWVVSMDGPVTTGRFVNVSRADSDGAGPTAGPNSGPAIPGQDFLNPAVYLTDGYVVVISVEPDPDNSPAPFTLKPLVDMNVEDAGDLPIIL